MPDGVGALMDELKQYLTDGETVPFVQVGTVLSRSPTSVRYGRFTLSGDALAVNPHCLYEPKKGEPPNPSLIYPGDQVVVVTGDGQNFYLICKVV